MRTSSKLVPGSLVALCALSACVTPASDRAALIVNASAQSRAALQSAVGKALHRDTVTLADDALTSDSILLIEPVRPRDAAGVPLQGRETRAPEKFRLVQNGHACILIHERTNQRELLVHTQCAAICR